MKTRSLASLVAVMCLPITTVFGAVSFTFDYSDPSASAWSNDARTSLGTAASNIAGYLSAYTANITMKVSGSNANTDTLASAGSRYAGLVSGFGNLGVVGNKIISNGANDLNGGNFDGDVDANFFHNWSFSSSVSGTQFDFTNVMMHELTHALGFAGLITQAGAPELGSDLFSPFDQFTVNGAGVKMVNNTLTVNTGAWAIDSIGGTGTIPATVGLYFDGPNAVAANGGNLVPLYSPTTWSDGSTGSHLDTDFYTGGDKKLMNHAVDFGLGVRGLSDIELGILKDLGYTQIAPIPEASTFMIALLGLLPFARRRR